MPALRSPIRSPFKRALRTPFDYSGSAAASVAPATGTIAHFGDSKTLGINAPAGEDYPAQLLAMISTGATTWTKFNNGVSGQYAATIAGNIQAQCVTAFTGQLGPKIAFVRAGLNDLANSISAATVKTSIDSCVANAIAGGATKVYVFSIDNDAFFTAPQRTEANTLNAALLVSYPTTLISPRDLDARFAFAGTNDVWDGLHEFSYGYNCVARFCADKLVADGYIAPGAFNYAAAATPSVTAGTYATWQSSTLTPGTALKTYYSVDGTDPSVSLLGYLRAIPIISSRTLKTLNCQVNKYQRDASYAYAITTAFTPTTHRRYDKGGAAGATWTDVSGNGRDVTLFNSPTINGNGTVTFNGTNQRGKAAAVTLAQPLTVILRVNQPALPVTDFYLFDGNTTLNVLGRQWLGGVDMYAGSVANQNTTGFIAGTPQTIAWIFNAASSLTQLEQRAPVSGGNCGANSQTGWAMASNGNGSGNFVAATYHGAMVVASALSQSDLDAHIQWTAENWT